MGPMRIKNTNLKKSWFILLPFLILFIGMMGCDQETTGTLEGVVTLENQETHEGIEITLLGTQYRAVTESSGTFKIRDLPAGDYTLRMDYEGYRIYRDTISVSAGEEASVGEITLSEKTVPYGSITGFVKVQGEPTHEDVLILLAGTPYSAVTNTTGMYTIDQVPPGSYKLIALKEGLLPVIKETIDVVESEETEVDQIEIKQVAMFPTPTPEPEKLGDYVFRGAAFYEGKLKHDGIRVELEDLPSKHDITNASGIFEITELDEKPRTLVFSSPGYVTETLDSKVPSPATESQMVGLVTLQKEYTPEEIGVLRGQVLLLGETNHADTLVRLQSLSQSVTTDEAGRYMFVGIPSGSYTLVAEHPGYASGTIEEVKVAATETTEAEDLVLQPTETLESENTGNLEGRVLLEDANDHGGVTVAIQDLSMTTLSSRDGRYRFSKIPAGSYTLIFSKGGYITDYLEGVLVQANSTFELDSLVLERDLERPYVVDTHPRHRSRRVPVDHHVDVLIRFSMRMDGESVKQAVSINPPVTFDAFFDRESDLSNFDVLHLRLYQDGSAPVRLEQQYNLAVDESAQTPEGVSMAENFFFSFTTDGPLILRTYPEDNMDGVILGMRDPMMIETNAPIDPVSFERSVRFRPAPDSEPLFQYYPAGAGTQIVINAILKPNTRYRVFFNNSMRTVNRRRFSNTPFTLNFRTGGVVPSESQAGRMGLRERRRE